MLMYPHLVTVRRGIGDRPGARACLAEAEIWCHQNLGSPFRWLITLEYNTDVQGTVWCVRIRTQRQEDHALVLLTWG